MIFRECDASQKGYWSVKEVGGRSQGAMGVLWSKAATHFVGFCIY